MSYSIEFDDIRRLRKSDDPALSQGEWVREIRTPQWAKVRDLCEAILETRSKDLQVACWYLESMTQMEGFQGVCSGLELLEGLLARYWNTESPALFPADPEERIARLEWLNKEMQIPMAINNIAMTSPGTGGYSRLRWEESRLVENLGLRDPKAKEEAVAEGKLSGEAWDKAAGASGSGFYTKLLGQIQEAQDRFHLFQKRVDQRLAQDAPDLGAVREALEGCAGLAVQMSRRFGAGPRAEAALAAAPTVDPDAPPQPVLVQVHTGPIASRAEAIHRLREIARYFRDHEPHSPVGPLAERAARWGEMPLGQWLARVVKDEHTLGQLQELLDLYPEG